MDATIRFAEDIAGRLGEVPGVAAVALGGSWARGEACPDSDVDLGLYYSPDVPPDVEDLRRLARDLDDRPLPGLVTDVGAWGPWINGGGWLRIADRPLDWLYRDAGKVRATVERCLDGQTACHYQPGHPHGFHEHIYPGEVHHCRILHDPEDLLRELKAAVGRRASPCGRPASRRPGGRLLTCPGACSGVWLVWCRRCSPETSAGS